MILKPGTSKKVIADNIRGLMEDEGKTRAQAAALALNVARAGAKRATMAKVKKAAFDIATRTGSEPVKGEVLGAFGIHRQKYGYGLTHLPSGMSVAAGPLSTKADALEALRHYHAALGPHFGEELRIGENLQKAAYQRLIDAGRTKPKNQTTVHLERKDRARRARRRNTRIRLG